MPTPSWKNDKIVKENAVNLATSIDRNNTG